MATVTQAPRDVLTDRQLVGLDDGHVAAAGGGVRLQPAAACAFERLREDARRAGFELAAASTFRDFRRQLAIWDGKVAGRRPVHDDRGQPVALARLSPGQRVHAVWRFSALPGTSRHHWGTDLDVYDAVALAPGETPALTPAEGAPGGIFGPLHRWLDERIAAGASHGFFRPYARDRGGVAPERWHLSYAPLALALAPRLTPELLRRAWDEAGRPALAGDLEAELPALLARYHGTAEGAGQA